MQTLSINLDPRPKNYPALEQLLEKAIQNRVSHYQQNYTNDCQLPVCETSHCIAGDTLIHVARQIRPELNTFQDCLDFMDTSSPWEMASAYYNLTELEAVLCFSSFTTYLVHQFLLDSWVSNKRVYSRSEVPKPRHPNYYSEECFLAAGQVLQGGEEVANYLSQFLVSID